MAPGFPQDIVSRIKEETDIVQVVRAYLTLAPAGTSFKALCPFHREKTPSFHVNPDRQIYKCFGCDEGGDVISFLMKIEGISFPEALETLARPLDIDLASYLREDESEGERVAFHRANEVAAGIWRDSLWEGRPGKPARQYLAERGFGEDVLRRFEVGFAPASGGWFIKALRDGGVDQDLALGSGLLRRGDRGSPFAYFRNRIIFPIKNIAQRVAGFGGRVLDQGEPKYLNSADSPYFSKGKLLYGFAVSRMSIARLKTAILVEGYLDLLALAQAGFGNVVATCGTAFTSDQAKVIRRGCSSLVVLFDGDRAGLQASVKASHAALAAGLEPRVARLPAGEDPASLLVDREREALEEVLADATSYLPFLKGLVEERGAGRQGAERALRQALKSILLVQDPIRQEYLLQEAADLFGIRREILQRHLEEEARSQAKRGPRGEEAAPPAGADKPPAPEPSREGRVRPLAGVNRPKIEATLLAHALRDETGEAAGLLLRLGEDHEFSQPEAEALRRELDRWQESGASVEPVSPARFVQDRWHEKGDPYRKFVSELLTEEVVPERTDFARVIRDCLARLQGVDRR